ncbi:MAG TPA: chemotaxis protein CheX [Phycisphaerae bacterium]|nr:chemotaxis protein CheX [Phycisphaerae bacterium]
MVTALASIDSTPAIVAPLIKSVRDTFRSMLAMEVTSGTPSLKTSASHAAHVSGVIGFSGELTGCVVVGFPKGVGEAVAAQFTGAAMEDTHPDFVDAIAEITNIIIGSAKSGMGVAASISIPTVIVGSGYTVAGLSAIPCFVIPCTCSAGEFSIEISVQQGGPKRTSLHA